MRECSIARHLRFSILQQKPRNSFSLTISSKHTKIPTGTIYRGGQTHALDHLALNTNVDARCIHGITAQMDHSRMLAQKTKKAVVLSMLYSSYRLALLAGRSIRGHHVKRARHGCLDGNHANIARYLRKCPSMTGFNASCHFYLYYRQIIKRRLI